MNFILLNHGPTDSSKLRDRDLKKRHRIRRFQQNIPLLIMFIPVIVFYILFRYGPMLGLVIAFKDYNFIDGIFGSEWVGMKNFQDLFSNPRSLNIIRNTFVLSLLQILAGFPVPIVLAIMINEVRRTWFKKTVQTLVYLPHFFSWVIVGGIVLTVFSQETGIVNAIIQKIIGEPHAFLYKPVSWVIIFLTSGIWKEAGFSAIIYLAALTTIDTTLYEASAMDGTSKLKQIWHISLPGIRDTIILLLILSMGSVMDVGFEKAYMLQNSVVSNVSEVIGIYIFQVGLQGGQFSLTAAMGFFESLVGLVLVLTANYIAKHFDQGLW